MNYRGLTIGIVGLAVVVAGFLYYSGQSKTAPGGGAGTPTVPVPQLTAKGSIVPQTVTKLAFKNAGRLALVGVELGDRVESGAVVARLESEELELAVRAAADAVAIQQALLDQLRAGARPEELAAAQTGYEGALAKYEELRSGATVAEVKAGEQGVAAAQAELARLESALAKLKAGVDPQAIRLAEQAVERAKSALWAAQIERDGVKGNRANPEFAGAAADARVMAAEIAVQEAQTKLEQVQAGTAKAEELAAAEQAVKSAAVGLAGAEAKLTQLRSGGKPGELASARSVMEGAKAQLDLKRNGPASGDVAVAQARLRQAETQLAQAEQALANAELKAPFAGTVTALGARTGEHAGGGAMVVTLADLSALRVETSDLDEYAAKSAIPGRDVLVSINALPDRQVAGKVRSIAPVGMTNANGDTTFTAVIDLAAIEPVLRPGMTVKVIFGGREGAS